MDELREGPTHIPKSSGREEEGVVHIAHLPAILGAESWQRIGMFGICRG